MSNHGGYKGLEMPPDDMEDWRKLVQATAVHLVGRYGLAEVSQWHFEVTPNIFDRQLVLENTHLGVWALAPRCCSEHHHSPTHFQCAALFAVQVWNEMWGFPDTPDDRVPEVYMALYNASATGLKAVHPSLRVGGPARRRPRTWPPSSRHARRRTCQWTS